MRARLVRLAVVLGVGAGVSGCPYKGTTLDSGPDSPADTAAEPLEELGELALTLSNTSPFSELASAWGGDGPCTYGDDDPARELLILASWVLSSKTGASVGEVCVPLLENYAAAAPPPPIGDCPTELTGADATATVAAVELAFDASCTAQPTLPAMNATELGSLGNPPGYWLQVALADSVNSTTPAPNLLWLPVMWSMQKFKTGSVLQYRNAASDDGTLAIYGLKVFVSFLLTGDTAIDDARRAEVNAFLADPFTVAPPAYRLRFRFGEISWADTVGAYVWPPYVPTKRPNTGTTGSVWDLSVNGGVKPLGIIDPITADDMVRMAALLQHAVDEGWDVEIVAE